MSTESEFHARRDEISAFRAELDVLALEVESLPDGEIKQQLASQLLSACALLGIAGRLEGKIESELERL